MSETRWSAVDRYLAGRIAPSDPALDAALEASAAAGLPPIQVSPSQGKLLQLLARTIRARHILEVGTLGGYSTIWLARALPQGGRLTTLEASRRHAEVARANIVQAGLADLVDLRVGPALDTLPGLAAKGASYDLTFIDADKPAMADYFRWAVDLSRPGSLIIADNVIRDGAVIDAASDDVDVQGARRFFDALAAEPRVSGAAVQTVGNKGYDGFAVALVLG